MNQKRKFTPEFKKEGASTRTLVKKLREEGTIISRWGVEAYAGRGAGLSPAPGL